MDSLKTAAGKIMDSGTVIASTADMKTLLEQLKKASEVMPKHKGILNEMRKDVAAAMQEKDMAARVEALRQCLNLATDENVSSFADIVSAAEALSAAFDACRGIQLLQEEFPLKSAMDGMIGAVRQHVQGAMSPEFTKVHTCIKKLVSLCAMTTHAQNEMNIYAAGVQMVTCKNELLALGGVDVQACLDHKDGPHKAVAMAMAYNAWAEFCKAFRESDLPAIVHFLDQDDEMCELVATCGVRLAEETVGKILEEGPRRRLAAGGLKHRSRPQPLQA